MKTTTRAFASTLAAVALFSGGAAGTASADDRTAVQSWNVRHFQGYTTGDVTFHNRSVEITNAHVRSNIRGCVRVVLSIPRPDNSYETAERTGCSIGVGVPFRLTMPADWRGGAAYLTVDLHHVNADASTGELLAGNRIHRP
ncbi:hypothetical protein ABZ714_33545 [Streptomyces sp. NPDC006798]|uniref:hypothetical protein n=1 Tax=Streptomyces sp. NPDC006798 TaxID=3155462 RepID=UPI0034074E4E